MSVSKEQPPLTESDLERVREIASEMAHMAGALLPILHAVQEHFGYVPPVAVPVLAEVLNLSRAEVHGVITFYHFFRDTPPGERILYICRAEACQSMGARALADHAKSRLGIDFHETSADGQISLEPVFCLGNCACSPAVMVDEDVYGRVTPEMLDELIATRD